MDVTVRNVIIVNQELLNNLTAMTDSENQSLDVLGNISWGNSALYNWEDYVVGTYIAFIVFSSIVMNFLILCVMYKHRTRLIFTDYFIISLAITDLGSPVLAYPMACASSYHHKWLFGKLGCQLNGFSGFYFGICGMETLAVMSLIRYIKICHRQFSMKLNNCVTYYILIAIYLLCTAIAICPVFSWGHYDLEIFGTSCSVVWQISDLSYICFIMVTCLIIPFVVMCASYIGIVRETRAYAHNVRGRRHWSQNEIRLVKTTMFMCVAFVSAWTPYSMISMLNVFYGEDVISERISVVPHLVAKSSHLLNPVVYFFMNQKYQKYVIDMVRVCYTCKKELTEDTKCTFADVGSTEPKDVSTNEADQIALLECSVKEQETKRCLDGDDATPAVNESESESETDTCQETSCGKGANVRI